MVMTFSAAFLFSVYNGPSAAVVDELGPPQYGATLQAVFMFGYSRAVAGTSTFKPLAEVIRSQVPNAVVYDWLGGDRRVEEELPIYLNRTVLQADPARSNSPTRATHIPPFSPAATIVKPLSAAPLYFLICIVFMF